VRTRGPYAVQAEIAACHARAPHDVECDRWPAIVGHYDALAQVAPSPVVALNRAVAIAMTEGPAAALALVDALYDEPRLRAYHLLPATRADLLRRLGAFADARAEYERARDLSENASERDFLERRIAECTAKLEEQRR